DGHRFHLPRGRGSFRPATLPEYCRASRCAGVSRLLPVQPEQLSQCFEILYLAAQLARIAEAVGGFSQELIEHLLHPSSPAPAILRPKVFDPLEAFLEKGFTLLAELQAELAQQRRLLDVRPPGLKLDHMFLNNGLRARDFLFPRFAVLLDDHRQVVHIVEVKVVQLISRRLDISGHAQIHDKQSSIGPRAHRAFEHSARQNALPADGGDENVGYLKGLRHFLPSHDLPTYVAREFLSALAGPIGHQEPADSTI